jgi:multiple antibiotic resistance protein
MTPNNLAIALLEIVLSINSFGLETVRSIISLFVVINPIGALLLIISITNNVSNQERNQIPKTAVITAGGL